MALILDAAGRPVSLSDLGTPQAETAIDSIRSPDRKQIASTLTPASLGSLMRRADHGDMEAYFTLAEEIEERDPHFSSVFQTRVLSVAGLPVNVAAAGEDADEVALADDITESIVERPEFSGLVTDMMDGVSKGISLIETMWNRTAKTWTPTEYRFRAQRHFVFDADTLTRPMLRTDENPTFGEELAPFKWLVHAPKIKAGFALRRGLIRPVSVCYAAKRYTIQDWLAFMDVFGMPIRIGKYPTGQKQHKGELLRALQAIGTDASAVIPAEMEIELLESKHAAGGDSLFIGSAEYWDKQTSKVVLGQTMSSDDGASLSQSKTHERVRFDIRTADAKAVQDTINRDLIKPYVDLNYGPRDRYPQIQIVSEEPEDAKTLMEGVTAFVDLGGRVSEPHIRKRLGLPEPEEGDPLLAPKVKAAPPAPPGGEPAPDDDDDDDGDQDDDEPTGVELNSTDPRHLDANGECTIPLGANMDELAACDRGECSNEVDHWHRFRCLTAALFAPRAWPTEADRAESWQDRARRGIANGETFGAVEDRTEDAVDDVEESALGDWRPLVDDNVGELIRRLQAAPSFDEARKLLHELLEDEGSVMDVAKLTAALARADYRLRGIGDATDDAQV